MDRKRQECKQEECLKGCILEVTQRSMSSNEAIHPPVRVRGRHWKVLEEGQCGLAAHLSELKKLNLKTNGRIVFLSVRIKRQFK